MKGLPDTTKFRAKAIRNIRSYLKIVKGFSKFSKIATSGITFTRNAVLRNHFPDAVSDFGVTLLWHRCHFPIAERLRALPKTFKYVAQTMVFAMWSTRGVPGGSAEHENTTSSWKVIPESLNSRRKPLQKYEKLPQNHAKAFPSYQKSNLWGSFSLKSLWFGITFSMLFHTLACPFHDALVTISIAKALMSLAKNLQIHCANHGF